MASAAAVASCPHCVRIIADPVFSLASGARDSPHLAPTHQRAALWRWQTKARRGPGAHHAFVAAGGVQGPRRLDWAARKAQSKVYAVLRRHAAMGQLLVMLTVPPIVGVVTYIVFRLIWDERREWCQ